MSLEELLPSVLSLSRYDKLQLIRSLAEDLARIEDLPSESKNGSSVGDVEVEIQANEKLEPIVSDINNIDIARFDPLWRSLIESGQPIPIRFPDESYEAAEILWRLLEEGKSVS